MHLEYMYTDFNGIHYLNLSDVMHCFEIRTANVDYFVGEDPLYGQKDPTKVTMPSSENGIGAHLAKTWETAIRQALMPVTPQGNNNVQGPFSK